MKKHATFSILSTISTFSFSTLAAAVLLSSSTYAATITQLFAPGSLTLSNNFEDSENNADVTFNPEASLFGLAGGSAGIGPSGIRGLVADVNPLPLTGSFVAPQMAMGLWFGNDDYALIFDAVLTVYAGVTELGSVAVTSNGNDYIDQFIGLSSDMSFDAFKLSYASPGDSLAVFVDDLYVDNSAVPAPAAAWLLGAGRSTVWSTAPQT
jgi:hypothetical protein